MDFSRPPIKLARSPLGFLLTPRALCVTTLTAFSCMPLVAQSDEPDEVAALPTLTVVGSAQVEDATTEQSESLGSGRATLFKGLDSTRQIPQPVTVMTREMLDQRALYDLTDVLQNTPGVAVDYTDSERLSYHSRGFQIDSLQIDGLYINQSGSSFIQPDTAVLDRVEVLRGSSGMLRGSGNPSATVNMVRKRPTAETQVGANLILGSWDRRRLETDASGALNDAGTLRGRVVAVKDQKEFFQDAKAEDREVFYGVVAADLSDSTTLTSGLQFTSLDATGAWGNLPADIDGSSLDLPRDTYLGSDWNTWDRENQNAFVELETRFDNQWNLKLSGAYNRLRLKDFKQTYMSRPAGETNPYIMNVTTARYDGADSQQWAASAVADGPFELFGREHKLILGADGTRVKDEASVGVGNLYLTQIDIRDWDPKTSYPEQPVTLPDISADPTITNERGVFATTRLSITDPLALILGTRLSWWQFESEGNPSSDYKVTRQVTPYVGVTYDFTNNLTGYASYSEIFTPQNAYDSSGSLLAPITGEDYELGLKAEFFGGALTASAGLFQINNTGRSIEDANSPNPCLPYYTTGFCRTAGGKQQSKGWELEMAGELLPGWQLMGGYTNTRTEYVKDSAANTGNPLRSIDPKHQLRLFTSYRPQGELNNWIVGAGTQIQSDSYVTSRGLTASQSGYAVYNAMLGYRFNEHYAVQANLNNVFDKEYYKKYSPVGISNYYGDPRILMVSLQASF